MRRPVRVRLLLPSFRERDTHDDFDFSILKLSTPITFSSVAAPICLPSSESSLYVDQIATAIGWGHTSSEGTSSSILQEVDVTVISNQQCANSYGSQIKK